MDMKAQCSKCSAGSIMDSKALGIGKVLASGLRLTMKGTCHDG